ncbi:unnamed protein product [Pneumocystis jirovecii]|uniref:Uncharacterized protein n=1 Tax=Pneumocystis jirovecii TaxID=42068 RepID=L0PCI1_PNEJI|nr:unnamed protein product [Pneumocystis jirovecii]
MGALMGSSVGLCVLGGVHLLRHGPGRYGVIRTLGTTMLSSAATFGPLFYGHWHCYSNRNSLRCISACYFALRELQDVYSKDRIYAPICWLYAYYFNMYILCIAPFLQCLGDCISPIDICYCTCI